MDCPGPELLHSRRAENMLPRYRLVDNGGWKPGVEVLGVSCQWFLHQEGCSKVIAGPGPVLSSPAECVHHWIPCSRKVQKEKKQQQKEKQNRNRTREKRPFLLQCPSSALYWHNLTFCLLQRRNAKGPLSLEHNN